MIGCEDHGVSADSQLVSASVAADLEDRLVSFVREQQLPGASAGVVFGGQLAWSAAVGFADLANGRDAAPDALYDVASITKTFTGTAVLRLHDAGSLHLDDPATRWLPELRDVISPFGPIDAITIRQMLSHESGLAAEPPGTDWAVPRYEGIAARTLARASKIAVTLPPNTAHQYSDLAYQLLGEIITRASGIPCPEYLSTQILEPLGMSQTGYPPFAPDLRERQAGGYDWHALSDFLDPAPDMPPVWAEGGLWSCVEDLARWISFQLDAYQDHPTQETVLKAASRRRMHTPRYLAGDSWTEAWGISWFARRQADVTWIGHSGGVPGFTSTICFDPISQVGAIVLTNGMTGGVTIGAELAAVACKARSGSKAGAAAIAQPSPVPDEYKDLLGIYARPSLGGWLLRLEWRGHQLVFTTPELPRWQVPLLPSGEPDVFAADPRTGMGDKAIFRKTVDGRVRAVELGDATWIRLCPADV